MNGTNYCLLAKQTVLTATPERRLVKMIINVDTEGKATLISVSGIAL